MKNLSYGNKMRWAAGGLYGLLAVYQMFLYKGILQQGNLTNVYFTWMYGLGLLLGAAAMCAWMFHGREALGEGARRAVVAGTFFCVVFELLTYSAQTDAINITLYMVQPSLVENTVALYTLMVLRLLVLIFAAFLVGGTARDKAPEDKGAEAPENGGEKLEIVEVTEEIVLVEADETLVEKPEENTGENVPENAGEKAEENAEENEEKPAENAEK